MKIFFAISIAGLLSCATCYAQNTFPTPSGNVGIGTANPASALDIAGGLQFSGIGDVTPPSGLSYGLFHYSGVGLGIFSGAVDQSQGIGIWTNPNGVKKEVLRISSGGNVGIGTITPDAKLAVKGMIHTQEVKVDMNGWADYVFTPAYRLASLTSVKAYIDKNRHLPEVPSELEVAKEGINLGEMNKLLLKKIEELTLYLIEKDAQVKVLEERMNNLEHASASKGVLNKINKHTRSVDKHKHK